jgi:hypothetical protein
LIERWALPSLIAFRTFAGTDGSRLKGDGNADFDAEDAVEETGFEGLLAR